MLERERKIEDINTKTPEALNQDLLSLYDAIPQLDFFVPDDLDTSNIDTLYRTPDEDVELIIRRRDNLLHGVKMTDEEILYEYRMMRRTDNSEYRNKLLEKLEGLLENAVCTDYFQHTIRAQYGNYCYWMSKPQITSLAERNNTLLTIGIGFESLEKGIFEKESAKEIERVNYSRRIKRLITDNEYFESVEFLRTLIPSLKREGKELANWRDEFIQHYKDEP